MRTWGALSGSIPVSSTNVAKADRTMRSAFCVSTAGVGNVGDESIVNRLDVGGAEPDRGTDAGLGGGREIGAAGGVGAAGFEPATARV